MIEATINEIKLSEYGLMLTDASISEPVPNRQTVTVPNRTGKLDLSFKPITYQNRKVVLTCTVKTTPMLWEKTKADVYASWHGQDVKAIIDDEPDYYWTGFCEITSAERKQNQGRIKITIDAYPYRLAAAVSGKTATAASAGTSATVKNNGVLNVIPTFTTTTATAVTVSDGTNSYSFSGAGEHKSANIILEAGKSTTLTLTAASATTVDITWREGRF